MFTMHEALEIVARDLALSHDSGVNSHVQLQTTTCSPCNNVHHITGQAESPAYQGVGSLDTHVRLSYLHTSCVACVVRALELLDPMRDSDIPTWKMGGTNRPGVKHPWRSLLGDGS